MKTFNKVIVFGIFSFLMFLGTQNLIAQNGCYAAGTSLSFASSGDGTKYSSIQGGCQDGSSLDFQVGQKPAWVSSAFRSGTNAVGVIVSNNTGGARSGSVTLVKNGVQIGVFSVSQAAGGPAQPPVPNDTANCGYATLTRANPPSDVTYYWQSTSTGTSTANSSSSINRTTGSIYYIRAKSNSGLWSAATSVTYTIDVLPGVPINPTVETEGCGEVTLKRTLYDQNSGNGNVWYWQNSASGTSTANSNETITLTSGSVYYLRSKNTASGCWSNQSASVSYSIGSVALPAIPTVTENCGIATLTRANPPSGVTYYWQSTSTGTSTSNSLVTVTRTTGTTYYLRARTSAGCWSSSRAVPYSITPALDAPPIPSKSTTCGVTTLTRANPPSGVTYYWQSSSTGTSTANSSSTINRTSGTVYYLRAGNATGCWSAATSVTYTIDVLPGVPINPTVETEGCGEVTLKRTLYDQNSGNGNVWYWQNSASGTSTANSNETITLTSGSVYYLRSKNTASGCWSNQSASVSYSLDEPPTWYLDADEDGFAIETKIQCSTPVGTGWTTTVVPVTDCVDDDPLINPNTVWYSDSDGDNYKDPDGETRLQCSKPSNGNWTATPQSFDDKCPDYANNADGSNGCNSNCLAATVNPGTLEFTSAGGTQETTIVLPNNCATGYSIEWVNIYDDWLTITQKNNTTLEIVCDPGTEVKDVTVNIYINGQSGYGVRVKRGSTVTPPDPTDSCTAANINDITFGSFTDSQNVTVSYTGTCSGTLVLRHPYDANGVPQWLTVTKSLSDSKSFTLAVDDNTSGITYNTVLAPMLDDGNGNYTGLGTYFYVKQTSCLTTWYLDSDKDGYGDGNGLPRIGCVDPDNEPNDNPDDEWVSNNSDQCPSDAAAGYANGCPNGIAPEDWNTVTTQVYDITETLKGASKGYYNDFGKGVQSQSLDVQTNTVWATATLYDSHGRAAVSTLSAPIREGTNFEYKADFIENESNNPYSISNFETNPENPDPVGKAAFTLGNYYSENNTRELYQDITDRPYSKTVYSKLNPGAVLKTVGGNKINGEWLQGYVFTMRASEELSQSPAFGESKYNTYKISKTVSRDVDGVENVIFADSDGKTLAAARSGSEGVKSSQLTLNIPEQGYVDVHVPEGITGFTVSNPTAVKVHNLITEETEEGSTSLLTNGFYRVAVTDVDAYSANSINVKYYVNYYDYSLNVYDDIGRLKASYQPLGATMAQKPESTYSYNTLGQLIYTKSPDEGEAWFKYRNDGQIRFSQNSKQKFDTSPREFSYTNYDTYGRPVESGVYKEGSITFANADSLLENLLADITIDNDGLPNANCEEQNFTLYDALSTADIANLPTGYTSPSFLAGNVAKTSNYQSTTYYSYDIYGRVQWVVQKINGLQDAKTIDYEYDPITGQVVNVVYQKEKPLERFIHKYTYNDKDQLQKVQTAINENNYTTHAEYTYYETGALKHTNLAEGAQGIDYVYNLAGQLKSLNHPDAAQSNLHGLDANPANSDLFGMQIDYNPNDYSRTSRTAISSPSYDETDKLNGTIKSVRWQNDALQATGEFSYTYQYDRNNWLTSADFGGDGAVGGADADIISTAVTESGANLTLEASNSVTLKTGFHAKAGSDVLVHIVPSGGTIAEGDYDVSNISYDANGNIKSLTRKKNANGGTNAMDDLEYKYNTNHRLDGPNRLNQVIDHFEDAVEDADDIGSQTNADNYSYNQIGQLTHNAAEGISYVYNATGLVTEVLKDNKRVVTFAYNDRNHRVAKNTYLENGLTIGLTTHYVRDVSGTVMALYTNGILEEHPVYGASRLGMFYRQATTPVTVYELTDHLGNVRATFEKEASGDAIAQTGADYYPFGMAMPGRNMVGDYRYAFQGQEKDSETGKEAFELRLWDSRIGRWLTTDPAGQYASPYLGMGNNPISRVDSDGGEDNPVYGLDGKRRGSTIEGNGGDAIIFDGDFKGLSRDEVLGKGGFFLKDNLNFAATSAGLMVYADWLDLPNRSDFDGIMTLPESRKNRGGDALTSYIDISKIDFKSSTLSVEDFPEVGAELLVNFLPLINIHNGDANILHRPAGDVDLAIVHGTFTIRLLDVHGKVEVIHNAAGVFDSFDFKYEGFKRVLTEGFGEGRDFNFVGFGTGQINVVNPFPFKN